MHIENISKMHLFNAFEAYLKWRKEKKNVISKNPTKKGSIILVNYANGYVINKKSRFFCSRRTCTSKVSKIVNVYVNFFNITGTIKN